MRPTHIHLADGWLLVYSVQVAPAPSLKSKAAARAGDSKGLRKEIMPTAGGPPSSQADHLASDPPGAQKAELETAGIAMDCSDVTSTPHWLSRSLEPRPSLPAGAKFRLRLLFCHLVSFAEPSRPLLPRFR